jgi:hypothetical protein
MAKVISPLGSFSASGSIGGMLVFFSHKGRNVVRSLVIPANPKTEKQGDSRLLLGALGRANTAIVQGSAYHSDAKSVAASGQTYISQMMTRLIAFFGAGNEGVSALLSAYNAHVATSDWDDAADGLALSTVTIPYAKSTHISINGGAQLYALAVYAMNVKAVNPSLFDRAPYSTALASWTDTEITAFVSDLTTI